MAARGRAAMKFWLHWDGISACHKGRSLWCSWNGLRHWATIRHCWLWLHRRVD